ncbi:MAG: copper chaperone PCu(A)C [Burkholderiaceae bacterium]|jgi:copper(I)-binding protein|nr:copper chaperone PCu(A)C [Burkholderiaceae bacterium]MDH5207711.1 copper chaperone PCu(A)C [Burkholderiaceae bacterium]
MKRLLIAACVWAMAGTAWGQVDVTSAWARATVPGQMGTGAFMTIVSKEGGRLIGAASPVAGVVELHEMSMENNVMKMRPITGLDLPAGREIQLKPGGHHVMLLDLKRPLKAGDKVKIELRLETRDGKRVTQPVEVEVRQGAPAHEAHKQ